MILGEKALYFSGIDILIVKIGSYLAIGQPFITVGGA